MTKQELSAKLIDHYQCFNSERFYLDEYNEDMRWIYVGAWVFNTKPWRKNE